MVKGLTGLHMYRLVSVLFLTSQSKMVVCFNTKLFSLVCFVDERICCTQVMRCPKPTMRGPAVQVTRCPKRTMRGPAVRKLR